MVASSFLLAGLGSVMLIGRQVAYTPSAAMRRSEVANVINQISEELRCATLVLQQNPRVLEFVVADRNNDGRAERIRYEWSGTAGAPLYKTVNGGAATTILATVEEFNVLYSQKTQTTTLTTFSETAESVLASNSVLTGLTDRKITVDAHTAQQVNPTNFTSVPANAVSWNATKVEFFGSRDGAANETVLVQLRPTGEPNDSPTTNEFAGVQLPESAMVDNSWNTAIFGKPARDLVFHRQYALVWSQTPSGGNAGRLRVNDAAPSGVLQSEDAGLTWIYMPTRQINYRLYGTYTARGPSYDVSRNYITQARLAVRAGSAESSRIDASVPLRNVPEVLTSYWRADFNNNPTATNANGDSDNDWVIAGGGAFDTSELINSIWHATGAIETRPLVDFKNTTIVEARCRNTSVGGNGAVLRINADRQDGAYAPIMVYLQRQADGTQTLTLLGRTSDSATKTLFTRQKLPAEFIRYRLTIVPQYDLVNIQINDQDQGTFTYPTYAPSSNTDRFVTLYADTSLAEYDFVEVRAY